MNKHNKLFERESIATISFLFNNAHETDDFIIAGTRGWFYEDDVGNLPNKADFDKLVAREELRMRVSLKEAEKLKQLSPEKEIVVFMHFPPVWAGKPADGIINALHESGIKRVFFGHIHGNYTLPPSLEYEGINMSLISADYLDFVPKIIKIGE